MVTNHGVSKSDIVRKLLQRYPNGTHEGLIERAKEQFDVVISSALISTVRSRDGKPAKRPGRKSGKSPNKVHRKPIESVTRKPLARGIKLANSPGTLPKRRGVDLDGMVDLPTMHALKRLCHDAGGFSAVRKALDQLEFLAADSLVTSESE